MKFKIGDKVKVRQDLKNGHCGIDNLEDYQNDKVFTIEQGIGNVYNLLEDKAGYYFSEEMLMPAEEEIILKGVKKSHNNHFEYIIELPQKNGYVCSYIETNKIYIQYKQEILDEIEKEYLRAVIKPFRNRVKYIIKKEKFKNESIGIFLEEDVMIFPCFKKGTMYKGLEEYKEYTLEELGL